MLMSTEAFIDEALEKLNIYLRFNQRKSNLEMYEKAVIIVIHDDDVVPPLTFIHKLQCLSSTYATKFMNKALFRKHQHPLHNLAIHRIKNRFAKLIDQFVIKAH
ncbi:CLUMA_CG011129, isoform A [Clunio marinus]|uniref:CLUMA_CG011129, isoform A n=1 Tax=Clunio marinus TaxID=568069 RepID=A0A1J1IBU5_9DIPT|nr:CLUMA_CG011129, isoform A [Clunio marinus]